VAQRVDQRDAARSAMEWTSSSSSGSRRLVCQSTRVRSWFRIASALAMPSSLPGALTMGALFAGYSGRRASGSRAVDHALGDEQHHRAARLFVEAEGLLEALGHGLDAIEVHVRDAPRGEHLAHVLVAGDGALEGEPAPRRRPLDRG